MLARPHTLILTRYWENVECRIRKINLKTFRPFSSVWTMTTWAEAPSTAARSSRAAVRGWLGHNSLDVPLLTFTPLVSHLPFFPFSPCSSPSLPDPNFLTSLHSPPHPHLLLLICSATVTPHHLHLLCLSSSVRRNSSSSPSLSSSFAPSCCPSSTSVSQWFSCSLSAACERASMCVCVVMCWTVNWCSGASLWAGAQE